MKKNILNKITFILTLVTLTIVSVSAQSYVSKPNAVKNLADSAKEIVASLPILEEQNPSMYKVQKEKLRFVQAMLKGLKGDLTVEQVANKVLPKHELNVLQPSVIFIDTTFANTMPHRYIRNEILFLISY